MIKEKEQNASFQKIGAIQTVQIYSTVTLVCI